jgi:hypothetical protein
MLNLSMSGLTGHVQFSCKEIVDIRCGGYGLKGFVHANIELLSGIARFIQAGGKYGLFYHTGNI